MAGSVVPVPPGPPTQISGSNLLDTTIYNMDSTYAIWVGNSPSVSPNNGMRIGPLGTAAWAKSQGLCYICQDKAVPVTNPPYIINVNTTNDVNDVANPVDVATATAIAVFSQGVPPVDVPTSITPTIVNNGLGAYSPPPLADFVDVTKYNSLTGNVSITTPTGPLAVEDINYLTIWYYNTGMAAPVVLETISCHSNAFISFKIDIASAGSIGFSTGAHVNTSGKNYTIASSSFILSYKSVTPYIFVSNQYWLTNYELNSWETNAHAIIVAPNNATFYAYPSYRRGPSSISVISLTTGGTVTNNIDVQDVLSGVSFFHESFSTSQKTLLTQFTQYIHSQPYIQYVNTATSGIYTFTYSQIGVTPFN